MGLLFVLLPFYPFSSQPRPREARRDCFYRFRSCRLVAAMPEVAGAAEARVAGRDVEQQRT